MNSRMVRFALEMLVLSIFSSIGPIIYRRNRSLFDMWEICCLIFVPIFFLLAGKITYDFRVRRIDKRSKLQYGWYFGVVIFLTALFHAFATILFSPGGPMELKPYTWSICSIYAIIIAVLDFKAWKVLASSESVQTNNLN